jgi:hypothetical protein
MAVVNENPMLQELMMKSRMDDVQRRSAATQMVLTAYPDAHAGWSRQLGELLIRAGRRLAGPEGASHPYPRRPETQGAGAGC